MAEHQERKQTIGTNIKVTYTLVLTEENFSKSLCLICSMNERKRAKHRWCAEDIYKKKI